MKTIINLGRWLFVLPFLGFGILHFGPLEFSLPYVPPWLPFPAFWVYFVGVCFLAFTLSVVIKRGDQVAALLLALCLLLFVLLVHVPGAAGGDFMAVIAVLRDTAMAGAALMYAGRYARDQRVKG